VEKDRAMSRVTPLFSDSDLDLNQLERAQELAIGRLDAHVPLRQLSGRDLHCRSARGFLGAVDELIDTSLKGKPVPSSLCYTYNARNYTVTLQQQERVALRTIRVQRKNGIKLDRTYRDLIEARFSVLNHRSGQKTNFELLLGTTGDYRGAPLQIVYQPNWWFQVVLNLVDHN